MPLSQPRLKGMNTMARTAKPAADKRKTGRLVRAV